ncbi:MAG: class I SAM-dependent methyltransferase [Oscillospiraceae bacterium]|nr:class I SAM-dependent methyltransferase [Oscillospiraceae bacterium]
MAYENLAFAYDGLTTDVDYAGVLEFFESVVQKQGLQVQSVLDLACGTGSMSLLLVQKGYRVLGADISEEMLTVAMQKSGELPEDVAPPFFICQAMQRLRLPYGVDAVCCFLDSLNYVTEPQDCRKAIERVYAALNPGGIFFFDINSPHKLRGLDGQVFLDENSDSYCVWRAEFEETERICYYGIDLFRKSGKLWERSFEQHCEYAYEPEDLLTWLKEAGFARVELYGDRTMESPTADEQRIYFAAFKE